MPRLLLDLQSSSLLLAVLCSGLFPGCKTIRQSVPPSRYLAITHSALNRLTFFDLDRREVVGALPTQKLPHDMLLSADGKTLLVVNSGAQCLSAYSLDNPDLWSHAAAFMHKDTSARNVFPRAMVQMGPHHPADSVSHVPSYVNRDPVQALPVTVARHFRTDTAYPTQAYAKHALVQVESHTACFDCHDRSVGGKPFGPMISEDKSEIYLVHLAYRNLTILDAQTLSIKRQIRLGLPDNLSPIEVWVNPSKTVAFVTCRNEIGTGRRGVILAVDLAMGKTVKRIPAGIYPWHLVADPAGKHLYVNNFQSSRISIVDIEKREIVDSLVAQNGPSMMCFGPGSDELLVSCFYTDNVVLLNTRTHATEKVIHVDANPTSLLLTGDGKQLYVLCGGESTLNVADLESGKVRERYKLLFGAYAFYPVHLYNNSIHRGRMTPL